MSYLQCGEYYRHRYVVNTPYEPVLEEALLQGTFTHSGLEQILKGQEPDREVILYEILRGWLARDCRLQVEESEYEAIYGFGLVLAKLFYRASGRYRGEYEEPIRNKDGSIPKDLRNYPPASWSQIFKENPDWALMRLNLDNWASAQQELFTKVSFSFMVGKCFDWILHFRYPDDFEETLLVEYEFSPIGEDRDLVPFGSIYFNGKIDWAYRNKQGELVICDHKTNNQPPQPQDVAHSPQLLMYSYAVYRICGAWPELVCIHHVPSGQYCAQRVDKDCVWRVLDYLLEVHQSAEAGHYTKRLPTEYGSPCIKRDYRTQEVIKLCPFLEHCWPEYKQMLMGLSYLNNAGGS
jgi:hypothetical protein